MYYTEKICSAIDALQAYDENLKVAKTMRCKYRFCITCTRYRGVKQRLAHSPAINQVYEPHKKNRKKNAIFSAYPNSKTV